MPYYTIIKVQTMLGGFMKLHNSSPTKKSQQRTSLTTNHNSAAQIARDTALAQLRTAVVVLRNTEDAPEQIESLKTHIRLLLDAPEEMLWINYIEPTSEFMPGKPIKGRDQLPIIQKALSLIGIELSILYVDNPEEKAWVLDWDRGKKARLFWTKSVGWATTLYLGQGDSYTCTGFDLDAFLKQVGVDRTWWSSEW